MNKQVALQKLKEFCDSVFDDRTYCSFDRPIIEDCISNLIIKYYLTEGLPSYRNCKVDIFTYIRYEYEDTYNWYDEARNRVFDIIDLFDEYCNK